MDEMTWPIAVTASGFKFACVVTAKLMSTNDFNWRSKKYLCVINSAFKAFKNLQSLLIIVQVVP